MYIYDHVTTKDLFTLSSKTITTRLDTNPYRLTKPHVKKRQTQMFFTNRVINIWNNLPLDAVNSKTLNQFKNEIDVFLNEYMYLTNFSNNLFITK